MSFRSIAEKSISVEMAHVANVLAKGYGAMIECYGTPIEDSGILVKCSGAPFDDYGVLVENYGLLVKE